MGAFAAVAGDRVLDLAQDPTSTSRVVTRCNVVSGMLRDRLGLIRLNLGLGLISLLLDLVTKALLPAGLKRVGDTARVLTKSVMTVAVRVTGNVPDVLLDILLGLVDIRFESVRGNVLHNGLRVALSKSHSD